MLYKKTANIVEIISPSRLVTQLFCGQNVSRFARSNCIKLVSDIYLSYVAIDKAIKFYLL